MRLGAGAIRGGIIAAVVLVVLGAASATPWVVTLTLPRFGSTVQPTVQPPQFTVAPQEPEQRDPTFARTLENVATTVLVVLAAALIAFGLYWLVRRLREAWRPDATEVEADVLEGDVPGVALTVDIASLASAVARADAHLVGSAAPGDAVIAAWVALEDEAELQGAGRDLAQTATEFTSRLLERTPAPADAVAVLRGLYHRARFTAHPVTADDVRRARESLRRVAEALDAAVPTDDSGTEQPS